MHINTYHVHLQVVIERKERLLRLLNDELEQNFGPHARMDVQPAVQGSTPPPPNATQGQGAEEDSEGKAEKGTLYL